MERRKRLLITKKHKIRSSSPSTNSTLETKSSPNCERASTELLTTPPQNTSRRTDLEDSPPTILSSQLVCQEVYWDDNTPQMRKYRARLRSALKESDDEPSPIKLFTKRPSTPKLTIPAEAKVLELPEHDIPKAQEALRGIQELNKQFEKRKLEREQSKAAFEESTSSTTHTNNIDNTVIEQQINYTSDAFSDDDSLLLQCTQEAEQFFLENESHEHRAVKKNPKLDEFEGFESDDSFELLISQMDEKELNSVSQQNDGKENEAKRAVSTTFPASDTVSSRTIKKLRSNDYDFFKKDECVDRSGATVPFRRIKSAVEGNCERSVKVCSQEEIERKKAEAKRKRQLSQRSK